MSDNERPRDRHRERDRERGSRREPRDGRGEREREGAPHERRNRSRSPRRDRGGRRDNRYRSRSPDRRDERDRARGRGRGRDRDEGGSRDDYRADRDRAVPTGPRSDFRSSNSVFEKPPPTGPRASAVAPSAALQDERPDVEMKEERARPADMDDETWEMYSTMGFGGFKSTKNTKVPGNDKNFGVRKDKQMEARQYMNRQGGFNRPLSPSRG